MWEMSGGADAPVCCMAWKERDGPAAAPPDKTGFGSTLIERSVKDQLRGTIATEFTPQGITCAIEFPLQDNVSEALPA
jgi:two-component sensor histidine kinase